jgi:UDP-N-acetylmuramoylalanine--D-glutamate ligase
VIGVDDEPSRAIAADLNGAYAVMRVAVGHGVETGVLAADGVLHEMEGGCETARADLAGIGSLRGVHNWQNAAVAYALARSQGLSPPRSPRSKELAGLHRMEQVARRGKVLFTTIPRRPTPTPRARRWRASPISIDHRRKAERGGLAGLEPFFRESCELI